jgi:hypothetical protein
MEFCSAMTQMTKNKSKKIRKSMEFYSAISQMTKRNTTQGTMALYGNKFSKVLI